MIKFTNDFDFPIKIIKSNRKKTASIKLKTDIFEIRVPKRLSNNQIKDLIINWSTWMKKKINESKNYSTVQINKYRNGEKFSYLGRNYILKIASGNTTSIKLKGGVFELIVKEKHINNSDEIKSLLSNWYINHAKKYLYEKTILYSKIINVQPKSIRIKKYKSKWGSCSYNGNISYSWPIIMSPIKIIDYLVVHELCHLIEHNHSNLFWQKVQKYVPDYMFRKKYLNLNSKNWVFD